MVSHIMPRSGRAARRTQRLSFSPPGRAPTTITIDTHASHVAEARQVPTSGTGQCITHSVLSLTPINTITFVVQNVVASSQARARLSAGWFAF